MSTEAETPPPTKKIDLKNLLQTPKRGTPLTAEEKEERRLKNDEALAEMQKAVEEKKAEDEYSYRFSQLPHKRPLRYHLFTLGGCLIGAAWVGAIYGMTSKLGAPGLIENFDDSMDLLYEEEDKEKLEKALKTMVTSTYENDTAKRMIMASERDMKRILELCRRDDMTYSVRNLAAKVVDNLTLLPENQVTAVSRGYHRQFIDLIHAKTTPLLLAKTASFVLCNLLESPEHYLQLARAGAVAALDQVNNNEYTHRQATLSALIRLCHAVAESKEAGLEQDMGANQWALAHALAEQHVTLQESSLFQLRSKIVESGVILYFHTVVGGGLWGAAYSLHQGVPLKTMTRNILRTAFITGVIPAYFVGMSVSLFTHLLKQVDTDQQMFQLYSSAAFLTVYPWSYLIPIVDRWSPLWLGGHVVGFASFFIYMIASDSDLLKTDEQLKLQDRFLQASADEER